MGKNQEFCVVVGREGSVKLRQAGGYDETGAESAGKRVDQKYKENLMEKD